MMNPDDIINEAETILQGPEACEYCLGAGMVGAWPNYQDCICVIRRNEARRREAAEQSSHIPKRFQAWTWDTHPFKGSPAWLKAREYVQGLTAVVYIWGRVGSGKTGLALAAANEARAADKVVLVYSARQLLEQMYPGAALATPEGRASLLTADLLVIDEYGQHRATEFAESTLSGIVNDRYQEEMGTILTSNLALEKADLRLKGRVDHELRMGGAR